MKHQRTGRKLGRERDQRKALLNSLMGSLVQHGKIKTTEAKAREIRPRVEKMVTRARHDTVANRRILSRSLPPVSVKKIMSEIGPRYAERKGGYTRVIKLGQRRGDGSPMAIIEFV